MFRARRRPESGANKPAFRRLGSGGKLPLAAAETVETLLQRMPLRGVGGIESFQDHSASRAKRVPSKADQL